MIDEASFRREDGLYLWDRRPDESGRAYEAFCLYRDAGAARSVDQAYRAATGRQAGGGRAAGRWWQWSEAYTWLARATAYDTWLELRLRQEAEEQHLADLAEFRERQRRAAIEIQQATLAMLQVANDRLAELATDLESIPAGAVPGFYRAIARLFEAAAGAEAQALGVGELYRLLVLNE